MAKKSFIERMLDKILSVKWPSPEGHFLTQIPRHPIYVCRFYIWEENRMTTYDEWIAYYKKQEKEERRAGKHYTSVEELIRGIDR